MHRERLLHTPTGMVVQMRMRGGGKSKIAVQGGQIYTNAGHQQH